MCNSCLFSLLLKEKRTNLKKPNSERTGHGFRVKFNPLALLLDASLEGEFDLVQRIIYEVCHHHAYRFHLPLNTEQPLIFSFLVFLFLTPGG